MQSNRQSNRQSNIQLSLTHLYNREMRWQICSHDRIQVFIVWNCRFLSGIVFVILQWMLHGCWLYKKAEIQKNMILQKRTFAIYLGGMGDSMEPPGLPIFVFCGTKKENKKNSGILSLCNNNSTTVLDFVSPGQYPREGPRGKHTGTLSVPVCSHPGLCQSRTVLLGLVQCQEQCNPIGNPIDNRIYKNH